MFLLDFTFSSSYFPIYAPLCLNNFLYHSICFVGAIYYFYIIIRYLLLMEVKGVVCGPEGTHLAGGCVLSKLG
jgi:hypothetical protein